MNEVPERRSYRLAYITFVVVSVTCFIATVGLVISGGARSNSEAVRESQARQDCKTVISSYRGEVLDARDGLVFDGLVASATHDEATIDKLRALAPTMRDAVHATPTAAEIVEHGWHVPQVVRGVVPDLPAYIAPCPS